MSAPIVRSVYIPSYKSPIFYRDSAFLSYHTFHENKRTDGLNHLMKNTAKVRFFMSNFLGSLHRGCLMTFHKTDFVYSSSFFSTGRMNLAFYPNNLKRIFLLLLNNLNHIFSLFKTQKTFLEIEKGLRIVFLFETVFFVETIHTSICLCEFLTTCIEWVRI